MSGLAAQLLPGTARTATTATTAPAASAAQPAVPVAELGTSSVPSRPVSANKLPAAFDIAPPPMPGAAQAATDAAAATAQARTAAHPNEDQLADDAAEAADAHDTVNAPAPAAARKGRGKKATTGGATGRAVAGKRKRAAAAAPDTTSAGAGVADKPAAGEVEQLREADHAEKPLHLGSKTTSGGKAKRGRPAKRQVNAEMTAGADADDVAAEAEAAPAEAAPALDAAEPEPAAALQRQTVRQGKRREQGAVDDEHQAATSGAPDVDTALPAERAGKRKRAQAVGTADDQATASKAQAKAAVRKGARQRTAPDAAAGTTTGAADVDAQHSPEAGEALQHAASPERHAPASKRRKAAKQTARAAGRKQAAQSPGHDRKGAEREVSPAPDHEAGDQPDDNLEHAHGEDAQPNETPPSKRRKSAGGKAAPAAKQKKAGTARGSGKTAQPPAKKGKSGTTAKGTSSPATTKQQPAGDRQVAVDRQDLAAVALLSQCALLFPPTCLGYHDDACRRPGMCSLPSVLKGLVPSVHIFLHR